jgi:Na+/melibiose symporter-like transporter
MGTAQMLGGVGVLAGSFLVKPLTRRVGIGNVLLAGLAASTVGWVVMPLIPASLFNSAVASATVYGIAMFFVDLGATLFYIPYGALRQKVTPDAMLGRMIGTMRFLTVAMAPVGSMIAGVLGQQFGVRNALGCIGVAAFAQVLATLFASDLRKVKD